MVQPVSTVSSLALPAARGSVSSSPLASVDASDSKEVRVEEADAERRAQHGDQPEADDDSRLGPTAQLEVMMDRRHAEDAATAEQPERRDLEDHRHGLHDE